MSDLKKSNQELKDVRLIELWEIRHCDEKENCEFRWTTCGETVSFDGNEYAPFPIQGEGFEINSQGSTARPVITIGFSSIENDDMRDMVVKSLSRILEETDGLHYAKIRRIRTLDKFLDGMPQKSQAAIFPVDNYRVFRVAQFSRTALVLELFSSSDRNSLVVPGRKLYISRRRIL